MDAGKPEAQQRRYFAVGEFVVGQTEQGRIDDWASQTKNRCGTFDFAYREALLTMVKAKGFFDMGGLPNFQQGNRLKTVPFINNHDTWRGVFPDSGGNGRADHTGNLHNGNELVPTIDPDDGWAKVAYAAMMAVDGSPQVYYEDLFKTDDPATRKRADPKAHLTRPYVENLVWCHQKLNFKDGAYKVRFQGSSDLLVIERAGKAVIGLNDNGTAAQKATVQTEFGANVPLHDYSGSTADDVTTDGTGKLTVTVPARSYCVWGPRGVGGGFTGHPRRTTQEFQLDDDLGDSHAQSLRYGGRLVSGGYRTAGAVWVAQGSVVKVWASTDAGCPTELRVSTPAEDGSKAVDQGSHDKQGTTSSNAPLYLEFTAQREGYHVLAAKLSGAAAAPARGYIKVEYEAPRESTKY
jgi:alpha-amylase